MSTPAGPSVSPVRLEGELDEKLSRWLWLVKWILAIPHFIIVAVLSFVSFFTVIIAGFAVLFTGKYPEGLYKFIVGMQRWSQRATLYALFMTDEYPPFSLDP